MENKVSTFFTQENCDRCGNPLTDGRIMSMYNTDCICKDCKSKEVKRQDYKEALRADHEAIKQGNYGFEGIGLKVE